MCTNRLKSYILTSRIRYIVNSRVLLALCISLFYLTVQANANNTVMVTASTGELGQEISLHLASEGYDLILTGRSQEKLSDLKNEINKKYKNIAITTEVIEFTDTKTIENTAKKIPVNSLKGLVLIGPRPLLSKEDIPNKPAWSKAFLECFIGPLEVVKLFNLHIQPKGSLVVIAGNTSRNYMPNYPNTNVIRLAWIGAVKNLVHFFAERKIRVNAVSPGPLLTQFHIKRIEEQAISKNISFEEQLSKNAVLIPLKSYGKPEDLAKLVSFMISDHSTHLNGANIPLDGGESQAY